MTQPPQLGYGHSTYNMFIRDVQPVAPDIYLAEVCHAESGKSNAWYHVLLKPSPEPNPAKEWVGFAQVKAANGQRKGQFKVTAWGDDPDSSNPTYWPRRWFEAYFWDQTKAVQWMIHNATEFLK